LLASPKCTRVKYSITILLLLYIATLFCTGTSVNLTIVRCTKDLAMPITQEENDANRMTSLSKELLAAVYCDNLQGNPSTVRSISEKVRTSKDFLIGECKNLAKNGLLKSKSKGYHLTNKGRKKITVVFAGGVFDIIHPGHVHTLSESKKLGDVLVVSVARNSTVIKNKGHEPVNDEELRRELVQALKCVDLAILGSETNIFETVEKVKPNVIALGYDQKHNEKVLVEESAKRGINVKVVRLSSPIPSVKSSNIIKEQSIMKDF